MAKSKIIEAQENDIQEDIVRYEEKLSSIKSEIDSRRGEIFTLEGHIEKTNIKLGEVSQDVASFNTQKEDMLSQIALLERTKSQAQTELTEIQSKLSIASANYDIDFQELKDKNDKRMKTIESNTAKAKDELAELKVSIDDGRAEISRIDARKNELSTEAERLSSELQTNKDELTSICVSIEEIKEQKTSEVEKCTLEIENKKAELKKAQDDVITVQKQIKESLLQVEKAQKEAFALGERSKALDARENAINAKEQKVMALYEKAGITL